MLIHDCTTLTSRENVLNENTVRTEGIQITLYFIMSSIYLVISQYKACLRKSRFNFDKCQTKKLVDSRFKNAKMYCDMLKQCAGVKYSNVSLSTFEKTLLRVLTTQTVLFSMLMKTLYILMNDRNKMNSPLCLMN